jgi:hypothetical protein
MTKEESLSALLVDGYKKGEFERKILSEKAILSEHSYDTLLNMAAAMSVYINSAFPILARNIPLMTQSYENGLNKAKGDEYQKRRQAASKGHIKDLEKQNKIREIWGTGKYSSRDLCAEQECAALDMSYSSARKALRNTSNPS